MKQSFSPEELCRECPKQYQKYFEYCNSLQFDDAPDFKLLRGLIQEAADERNFDLEDRIFDWCSKLYMRPGFSSGTAPKRNVSKMHGNGREQGSLGTPVFSSVAKNDSSLRKENNRA